MDRFFNKQLIKQAALTSEMAHQLLHYDPLTGSMTWKVRRGSSKAGSRAGSLHHSGYMVVKIDHVNYLVHRLAWLMQTGSWPEELVDHRNGKSFDNRWENLRAASHALNQQNRVACIAKSGLMGVRKRGRLFWAQITVNKVTRQLGGFKTPEEAHSAYLAAKQIHHPHAFIVH